MTSLIDWPRALMRGQYAAASAASESLCIPIDIDLYALLRAQSANVRQSLVTRIDADFGVFEDGRFREALFEQYLVHRGIVWPRLKSGRLILDDDTFREMSRAYPQLAPLRQLRQTRVQLRELKLSVGDDGRNRSPLFPFSSLTGRNQPSTNQRVYGLASWLRGLIRPQPGFALAYVDFAHQELAIAADASGDKAMQSAYLSGDFYISFAIMAGAAPAHATKQSHPEVRERFKVCALGVLFGMSEHGLALRLGISILDAKRLLDAHRRTFSEFWRWSDATADFAMLTGSLQTVFGWTLHVSRQPNARSLRNFPMQANGAEMMRLAHIELTRRNIRVCTPVHDAFLIEAPLDQIDDAVAITKDIMRRASAIVLDGFEIRSDALVVWHPDRLLEPKGVPMWNLVMTLLGREDELVHEGAK